MSQASEPVVGERVMKAAKRRVVEAWEKEWVANKLAEHNGNVSAAARASGVYRTQFQRLMRKYGIRTSVVESVDTMHEDEVAERMKESET